MKVFIMAALNLDRVWFPVLDVINSDNDADNAKEDFYRIKVKYTGQGSYDKNVGVKNVFAVKW